MEQSVPSLVIPYGYHETERCGYCKGASGGVHATWGMGTKRLTVSDYQYLIDRGWRRSGTYCYKPMNKVTCCPCYTIRCDAARFRPSRSHKRLLKAFSSFLATGVKPRTFGTADHQWRSASNTMVPNITNPSTLGAQGDAPIGITVGAVCPDRSTCHSSAVTVPLDCMETVAPKTTACSASVIPAGDIERATEDALAPAKISKSRARRWEAHLTRMRARAVKENCPFEHVFQEYQERRRRRVAKNAPKELEYFLNQEPTKGEGIHYLELRLVRSSPPSEEFRSTLTTSYQVYKKYQMIVHGDEPDECTMEGFTRFLVKSPLVSDSGDDLPDQTDAPPLGSYHQQYWLDGEKLIAVGVIDLLPRCLSSVYFYYDPDYAFLQLGTYSALRELGFIRELIRKFGPQASKPHPLYAQFDSYYMGYFIRSCPKMAYKAQFHPSYLACPESFTWVPVQICLQRLDSTPSGKYARFANEDAVDVFGISDQEETKDLDTKIICRISSDERRRQRGGVIQDREDEKLFGAPIPLAILKRCITPEGFQIFRQWAKLLGQRVLDGRFQIVFR